MYVHFGFLGSFGLKPHLNCAEDCKASQFTRVVYYRQAAGTKIAITYTTLQAHKNSDDFIFFQFTRDANVTPKPQRCEMRTHTRVSIETQISISMLECNLYYKVKVLNYIR